MSIDPSSAAAPAATALAPPLASTPSSPSRPSMPSRLESSSTSVHFPASPPSSPRRAHHHHNLLPARSRQGSLAEQIYDPFTHSRSHSRRPSAAAQDGTNNENAPHSRGFSESHTIRSFVAVNRSATSIVPSHHPSEHQPQPAQDSLSPLPSSKSELPSSPAGTNSTPLPTAAAAAAAGAYDGDGSPEDPFIVCFSPNDPGDPRCWSNLKRWLIMTAAALEMTGGTLAISIYSSGTNELAVEFNKSRELIVLGSCLYLTALGISSLLTAPLGEMFGRRPVMIVSFVAFTLFNLGLALCKNIESYLVLRFISGFFGSASMSHGPAMANDLFSEHEIGLPLLLAGVGRFGGPVIGPLIGGFIEERAGWRWLGFVMTIFSGFLTIIALLVPETYAPAILRARAQTLAKSINAHHITSYEAGRIVGNWKQEAQKYLLRPFIFLCREPIVLLLSLHVSFLYGILNLYFAAYPYIFVTIRGWSIGNAGLPFIAVLIGFILSIPIAQYTSKLYTRAARASPTGRAPPEERLWFGILGAILIPISLFWLGWSAQPNVHWAAPVVSGVIFGMGQLGLTLSVFTYFSDTYTYQMGSVLAGSNFMRFIFGGVFPLFSQQMFLKLQPGWTLSLLGFLCVLFLPAPILFYVYGARIRSLSKYVPRPPADAEKGVGAVSSSLSASSCSSRRPSVVLEGDGDKSITGPADQRRPSTVPSSSPSAQTKVVSADDEKKTAN